MLSAAELLDIDTETGEQAISVCSRQNYPDPSKFSPGAGSGVHWPDSKCVTQVSSVSSVHHIISDGIWKLHVFRGIRIQRSSSVLILVSLCRLQFLIISFTPSTNASPSDTFVLPPLLSTCPRNGLVYQS